MLASFVITFQPQASAALGHSTGASLHALLFNLVGQADPSLAERLHADAAVKPFTVSCLHGRTKRDGDRRVADPEQFYWVRYTTLSDELFNALSRTLLGKFLYQETVTLDGGEFRVVDVAVEQAKSRGRAKLTCAADLWDRALPAVDVTVRFDSPTAFRQRGLNLLFPVPSNVFHSYREKWNALTPFRIDDGFIPWVEQNIAVEAHRLETRMMWFGEFELQGFTGWCRYTAKANNPTRLKELSALADFAFFCGTGAKTTQGMGQTRRVNST